MTHRRSLSDADILLKRAEENKPKKIIGEYKLTKTVGQGSMGKVKLAINQKTGEKRACKIMPRPSYKSFSSCSSDPIIIDSTTSLDQFPELFPKEKANSQEIKENRIIREAAIVLLLNHPHIAFMDKFVAWDNFYYMFFEYVNGGQMLDYIISHGKLKEKQARKFIREIISAVDYCHHNSIVHRDLKIENVLIDKDGEIKLIDFGLSNLFDVDSHLKTFCGSLYFAAPELLNAKEYIGPEVDIWSMGIILYVLVCGRVPFDDESMPVLYQKIKAGNVEYPSFLTPDCVNLLSKMLNVNSEERITMDKIKSHPWIIKGYEEPLDNYLAPRLPITLPLDMEVIKNMKGFGFGSVDEIKSKLEQYISNGNVKENENFGFLHRIKKRGKKINKSSSLTSSSSSLNLALDYSKQYPEIPIVSIYHLVNEKLSRINKYKISVDMQNQTAALHHANRLDSYKKQVGDDIKRSETLIGDTDNETSVNTMDELKSINTNETETNKEKRNEKVEFHISPTISESSLDKYTETIGKSLEFKENELIKMDSELNANEINTNPKETTPTLSITLTSDKENNDKSRNDSSNTYVTTETLSHPDTSPESDSNNLVELGNTSSQTKSKSKKSTKKEGKTENVNQQSNNENFSEATNNTMSDNSLDASTKTSSSTILKPVVAARPRAISLSLMRSPIAQYHEPLDINSVSANQRELARHTIIINDANDVLDTTTMRESTTRNSKLSSIRRFSIALGKTYNMNQPTYNSQINEFGGMKPAYSSYKTTPTSSISSSRNLEVPINNTTDIRDSRGLFFTNDNYYYKKRQSLCHPISLEQMKYGHSRQLSQESTSDISLTDMLTTSPLQFRMPITLGRSDQHIKNVNLKGLFSVNNTSTRSPSEIRHSIIRTLTKLGLFYIEMPGSFQCEFNPELNWNFCSSFSSLDGNSSLNSNTSIDIIKMENETINPVKLQSRRSHSGNFANIFSGKFLKSAWKKSESNNNANLNSNSYGVGNNNPTSSKGRKLLNKSKSYNNIKYNRHMEDYSFPDNIKFKIKSKIKNMNDRDNEKKEDSKSGSKSHNSYEKDEMNSSVNTSENEYDENKNTNEILNKSSHRSTKSKIKNKIKNKIKSKKREKSGAGTVMETETDTEKTKSSSRNSYREKVKSEQQLKMMANSSANSYSKVIMKQRSLNCMASYGFMNNMNYEPSSISSSQYSSASSQLQSQPPLSLKILPMTYVSNSNVNNNKNIDSFPNNTINSSNSMILNEKGISNGDSLLSETSNYSIKYPQNVLRQENIENIQHNINYNGNTNNTNTLKRSITYCASSNTNVKSMNNEIQLKRPTSINNLKSNALNISSIANDNENEVYEDISINDSSINMSSITPSFINDNTESQLSFSSINNNLLGVLSDTSNQELSYQNQYNTNNSTISNNTNSIVSQTTTKSQLLSIPSDYNTSSKVTTSTSTTTPTTTTTNTSVSPISNHSRVILNTPNSEITNSSEALSDDLATFPLPLPPPALAITPSSDYSSSITITSTNAHTNISSVSSSNPNTTTNEHYLKSPISATLSSLSPSSATTTNSNLLLKQQGLSQPIRFEILIVRIPWLNLHGIQFRRISGNLWKYKKICLTILKELKL